MRFTSLVALLLAASLTACSEDSSTTPTVPLPDAGAPDADAGADAAADSASDSAADAPADTATDQQQDALADAPQDAPPDNVDGASQPSDCDRLAKFDADLAAAADEPQKLAVFSAFVKTIEGSDGFPIRCGADVTFLFEAPQGFGTPPRVVGDFNGWDGAQAAMTAVAGSAWRATLSVQAGANRYLYKFTDSSQWVADPHARRFGYDQNGEYSLVSGGTDKGHLERWNDVAGAGLKPRPLAVYVPPGYETASQSYPVLYAHDGQNLFNPKGPYGSWALDSAVEGLIASSTIQPLIVVGIYNTGADRMDEYTHVKDDIGDGLVGGRGDDYYQLITGTIMPLVGKHYRVKTGPANTWTMGSSLGGLISLYFGMKYPATFGRVAGLSSTSGWGSIGSAIHNPTIIELLQQQGHNAVVYYLDSGGYGTTCADSDNDGIDDDDPSAADNYCENVQLHEVFQAAGFKDDVDVFHWWENGAEHNEGAWAARVHRPLQVLAGP